ncbi:fatty acid desaturase [Cytobacillus sp. Hz8]|uniref:fatty acid desaturase n=1 Tax=Cytobacillus sp. Hz8 TaxID=3347168 RepID=UPI0035D82BA9
MTKQKQIALRKQMSPYEKTNTKKSIWQMVNTIIPFILLWMLAYYCLSASVFLTIPICIVAAGFLVRIFIIFHDCCHYSFFRHRNLNNVIGTITGILTFFPYRQWQHDHAVHHATSSNLDKRGTGDIWVLTIKEYVSAPIGVKIAYRLYRNPLIMFGLGPIYLVLLKNRFNRKTAKLKERINTYMTNLVIGLGIFLLGSLLGWGPFLIIQGIIIYVAGVAGIWLFYVQHTFEDSYFEEDEYWDYVKAAVEGSSFYYLPKMLQWLTGNIGYHHVHHLSPRVPNYQLEEAHNQTIPLQNVPTITLKTSLSSLKFRLWDETNHKFVGYQAVKEFDIKSKKRVSF